MVQSMIGDPSTAILEEETFYEEGFNMAQKISLKKSRVDTITNAGGEQHQMNTSFDMNLGSMNLMKQTPSLKE